MKQYWIQLKQETWDHLCADGTKNNMAVVAAFWEKHAAYLLDGRQMPIVADGCDAGPESKPPILIMKDITAGEVTLGESFCLVMSNALHRVHADAHVILHQGTNGCHQEGNEALIVNIRKNTGPARIVRRCQPGNINWSAGQEYHTPDRSRTGACVAALLFQGPGDYSLRVATALAWLEHEDIAWTQVHPIT